MKIEKTLLLELHKMYRDHVAEQLSQLTGAPFQDCKDRLYGFRPNPKHFDEFCKNLQKKLQNNL